TLARGPDVVGGVRISSGSPSSKGCLEIVFEHLFLHDRSFERADVTNDADLSKILLEQSAQLDAIGDIWTNHAELEFDELAIDLLVANAVVIVIFPTGLIEQLFGLVEVLLVKRRPFLRRHPRRRMKDSVGLLVEAVEQFVEHFLVVKCVRHRLSDAYVAEE